MMRGRARQFSKKTSALGLEQIGCCNTCQSGACREDYEKKSGTYEKGNIDLREKTNEVQENAKVTTPGTERGAIWKLVKGVASAFPGASEADMCDTNTAPKEEVGKARHGEKPCKESAPIGRLIGKSPKAKDQLEDDGWNGSALLVDVRKEFWCHSLPCKRLNCPCGTVGC